jgi:ABC-2 type transport system ATP-binding protein
MRALLRSLAEAGKSILVSSHLLAEIEQICDHLVVIQHGSLLFSGPISDLERRQRAELVIRPEEPGDLPRLTAVLADHGLEVSGAEQSLRVAATVDRSASINRLAFQAGITLAELQLHDEALEDTFLRMMSERAE